MKSISKIFLTFTVVFSATVLFCSCSKEENKIPVIDYIRVTNPESSDSLLVAAGQGQLIAIMGKNLGEAQTVFFNDQQARITPTYVSNHTILVSVPSEIPLEIDNQLKIIFRNGFELNHAFEVTISKPSVASMDCEFVNEGEIATIRGNFFYSPVTVTLADGKEVELASVEDKAIQFIVPEGAAEGPITVTTNFGETESNFWFRDNRNVVIASDPFEGWNGVNFVVDNPGPNDPPKINGNYIRVTGTIGEWSWNEVATGPADAMPSYSKNIPDDAILNPEKYNLKFEVNTLKPYNASVIRFNFGIYDTDEQDNTNYAWNPPFDTKGKWRTVTIPFENLADSYAHPIRVNPAGYWTRVIIQGPGTLDADICFDTFRIVPKENK